ncbi:MAG: ABC transporter ATP-binding protein, partial [Lachnospiraceae bacterium]|nr:ABC transporter ATP-binding protein [Lachnospiraceae bacterium]
MTVPILSAKEIMFGYGKEPLFERFSMEVGAGETVSIVGANGAGKTTLLNCLIGSAKVWSGEVLLEGKPIREADRKTLYETVAYVPQKSGIPLSFTVLESVLIGLTGGIRLFGTPGRKEE